MVSEPGFKRKNSGQSNTNNATNNDIKADQSKSVPNTLTNDQYQRLMALLSDTGNTSKTHASIAMLVLQILYDIIDVTGLNLTVSHPNGTMKHVKCIRSYKLANDLIIKDVLAVPGYHVSLLFVHKLSRDNKVIVSFNGSKCKIQDLTRRHPSVQVLTVLKNKLKDLNHIEPEPCEVCHKAKQTREPFPLSVRKTKRLVDLVHLDVWGPYRVRSREWFKYFPTVVDDFIRAVWVFLTQSRAVLGLMIHMMMGNIVHGNISAPKGSVNSPNDSTVGDATKDKSHVQTDNTDTIDLSGSSPSKKESKALNRNNTWLITELPEGRKAIGYKWIYKVKYKSNGDVERFKAKLVAKGFNQREGIDYEETFSPVVKIVTIRCILSIAVNNKWPLFQLDINNVFLYGELEEDVYMSIPEGYSDQGDKRVCKLVKSLYGLKQAPRKWNEKLTSMLIENGFKQSLNNFSLLVKNDKDFMLILLVYVDDIIVTGNNVDEINKLKQFLGSKFLIKDLGKLKYFLGIEVLDIDNEICLTQRKYCTELLNEFGMLACKPCSTPIEVNPDDKKVVAKYGDDVPLTGITNYQKLMGKLIYLIMTRPDISYVVHCLSQVMHKPMQSYLRLAFRVLRYLKKEPGLGITFRESDNSNLRVFVDSDWAKCLSLWGSVKVYVAEQIYWKLLEHDIVAAIKEFFASGTFSPGCNSSFIALIPKIQDAKFVKDYCLISLIGSLYKIISKILANRLSSVISGLISDVQSAFVFKRQILDGPFILNELLSWCKHKKFKAMVFRVDFEKAFDSIRISIPQGLEIREPFISLSIYLDNGKFAFIFSKITNSGLFSGIPIDSSLTLFIFSLRMMLSSLVNGNPWIYAPLFIKAIYGKDGALNSPSSLSKRYPWLDIIREVIVLHTKGINLLDIIRKKMGNELKTLFWEDHWLDDLVLKYKFLRLYDLDNYKQITIFEIINHASMVDTSRQPPRGGAEKEQLGFLLSRKDGLILTNIPDRWVWL
nr:ribonuclease H-like domain-containing protein [Tanacetum cinerariifolium]